MSYPPQMCCTQAERLRHLSTRSLGGALSLILPPPRVSMSSRHRMSFRTTSHECALHDIALKG